MHESPEGAAAYSAGSDARLRGEPISANPHLHRDEVRHHNWEAGWLDVDRCWGVDSRKPVKPLPEVAA